jgi:hypothetical protein
MGEPATVEEDLESEPPHPRHFVVVLDREDRTLLEQVSATEKLTKSDVLRRALRRYAKELGLTTTPAA